MRFKLRNPLADPFLKTSLVWGLGLLAMYMCLMWAMFQLDTFDGRVAGAMPFLFVVLGSWYLVRFIGDRPAYHCFLCGAVVGLGLPSLGFISDEANGISWQGLVRYVLLVPAAMLGLGIPGFVVGWYRTRGRTPIAIEIPNKRDTEAAQREGRELPPPRIVTPVSAMPGSSRTNTALLEQLEKDPLSLLPERERLKLQKRAAKKK